MSRQKCGVPLLRDIHRAVEKLYRGSRKPVSLRDQPTPEANSYGVGSRARLQLREQVADVRFDGLLAEEEPHADLAVHEAVRDQLQNLDLPHRRLLLQLLERAVEGDHLAVTVAPPCGDLVEPARVIDIAGENLLALCGVHGPGIGSPWVPL